MARSTGRAWWVVVAAGMAALVPLHGASACPENGAPRTVQALVEASDLVLHGVVVRIEYENSAPAPDAPGGIPYTFVTYRVERVLRGAVAGDEVTLRFFGGYDRTNGTYLAASVSPQFDVGDEDLLFVRGNGQRECPLVGSARGRFRILDGQVYTDGGRSVSVAPDGAILRGRAYAFEAVSSVTVMGEALPIGRQHDAVAGASDAMFVAEFVPYVLLASANAPAPGAAFRSTEAGAPFEGRFPEPTLLGARSGVVPSAPVSGAPGVPAAR